MGGLEMLPSQDDDFLTEANYAGFQDESEHDPRLFKNSGLFEINKTGDDECNLKKPREKNAN